MAHYITLNLHFCLFGKKTPVVDSVLNVIQRVPSELLVFFVSIKIIILIVVSVRATCD